MPGLLAVAWLALSAACAPGSAPEVPAGAGGAPDPVLVEGRAVYTRRCAGCHGTGGDGGRGPKLAEGRVVERYPEIEDQVEVVTNGRGGMPAFADTLGPAEIEAVVRYTREVLSQT